MTVFIALAVEYRHVLKIQCSNIGSFSSCNEEKVKTLKNSKMSRAIENFGTSDVGWFF